MSFKKAGRIAVRVIMTNVSLAYGKVLQGGRLRCGPITCFALSDEAGITHNGTIGLWKDFRTHGRCRFNVRESWSLPFGQGVLLPNAKLSSIVVAISELMRDSALRSCHAGGAATSMCCFGLAEELVAAGKIYMGDCSMLARAEPGLVPGDFAALAIGDFNGNKNHCVFVEAVVQLPGNVRLLMAGDGPLHGRPEVPIEWLGVPGRVCLLKFRRDVAVFLNACDLLCLSLGHKGFSAPLIEAMVTGVSALASNSRGYADVLAAYNRDAGAWAERIAVIAEGGAPATPSVLRARAAVFGVVPLVSALSCVYEETLTGREAA